MGSDGIFDTMSNEEIITTVWETFRTLKNAMPNPVEAYDDILGQCVVNVMKRALVQQSEDNVTVMMVCFRNLLDLV